MSEFCNDGNSSITFSGRMYDGAKINFEGHKGGTFSIQNGVNIEGNCKFINESSGSFNMKNVNVPDGVILKNIGSKGNFSLTTASGGVVDIEPGTEFVCINDNVYGWGLQNWSSLKLRSGSIHLKNGSIVLNGGFGGDLVINGLTGNSIMHSVINYDWHGQEIKFNLYNNISNPTEKHLYLNTKNIENFLDVESPVSVGLNGSFADGTIIRISGNGDNGSVSFSGKYSGLISLRFVGGVGSSLQFYNDLNALEDFSYHSGGQGPLIVRSGVVLGKNVMINNDSLKSIYINSNVSIGDNVSIDVSEQNQSNIYISEDVPAGTYLSY